jgi:CheY-like chemotaxis protein
MSSDPTPTALPALTTLKLLVVDDSRTCLMLVRNILSTTGCDVHLCDSPVAALSAVRTFKPDVILCDLDMPEMHGFEFIGAVRNMPDVANIPILVMTGRMDSEAMAQSIYAGADAFISKDQVRISLKPHLLAMLRVKVAHEKTIQGKQLEAIQALIGTYKHEFGNSLAILEGTIRRLLRNHPALREDSTTEDIRGALDRIQRTLTKLDELREYSEDVYANNAKTLKVG